MSLTSDFEAFEKQFNDLVGEFELLSVSKDKVGNNLTKLY